MKSKIFIAVIALGLTLTVILVIKPVLAESFWNIETEDEPISPMVEEGCGDATMADGDYSGSNHMSNWGEDGELLEGAYSMMSHMNSSEEGVSCEGLEDGDHIDMMGEDYDHDGMMGEDYDSSTGCASDSDQSLDTYGSS